MAAIPLNAARDGRGSWIQRVLRLNAEIRSGGLACRRHPGNFPNRRNGANRSAALSTPHLALVRCFGTARGGDGATDAFTMEADSRACCSRRVTLEPSGSD